MSTETPRRELEFEGFLADILDAMPPSPGNDDFSAKTVIDKVETGLADYQQIAALLSRSPAELRVLFSEAAGVPVERLAIIACPDFLKQLLGGIAKAFDRFTVADSFKAGQNVDGVQIIHPDALIGTEYDALLIATSEHRIVDLFYRRFGNCRLLTLSTLVRSARYSCSLDRARSLAEKINGARRPLVILSAFFVTTLGPTFEALSSYGYDVFFLHRKSLAKNIGYALVADADIPLGEIHHVAFDEMLYLLQSVARGSWLVVGESFFHPRWDMKDTIGCYSYPAGLMRMARAPAILLQYDVIKPVTSNYEYESQSEHCYREMLASAAGVVLNSNGPLAGDFLRATALKGKPTISFYRFSVAPRIRKPKFSDGIHLVAISVLLGEAGDATRVSTEPVVRSILRQGIHLHYYSGWERAVQFRASLSSDDSKFFHIHSAILDQNALVDEITQYHAAVLMADVSPFAGLISGLKSNFYRDLFSLFIPSTLPTSISTCGCAGLPVITNRVLTEIKDFYSDGAIIGMEFSEIETLGKRLSLYDWRAAWNILEQATSRFSARSQVEKISGFIEGIVSGQSLGLDPE